MWSSLSNLKEALTKAAGKARKDSAAGSVSDTIERLRQVEVFVRETLDAADPFLVPQNSLDGLNSHLAQATQGVQAYLQDSNTSHLEGSQQSANTSADNVLQVLSQIFIPRIPEEVSQLRDRVSSFRKSAGTLRAHLQRELKALRETVSDVKASATATLNKVEEEANERLTNVKQQSQETIDRLDQATRSKQQELESKSADQLRTLEQRITDHETNLQTQKKRLDEAVSRQQEQFSAAQESRLSEFGEEQQRRKEQFEKLTNTTQESLEELSIQLDEKSKDVLERMYAYEKKAKNVMGTIGTTGLTAGFKQVADQERKAANVWRLVAVAGILGVIGVAVWTIASTQGSGPDWYGFARKVFLTAAVGWLAGYSIKEAAGHRGRERRNRRLELELASLDPYLANLEAETQQKIKDDLVRRWFAQPFREEPAQRDGGSNSIETLVKSLRQLLERVNE